MTPGGVFPPPSGLIIEKSMLKRLIVAGPFIAMNDWFRAKPYLYENKAVTTDAGRREMENTRKKNVEKPGSRIPGRRGLKYMAANRMVLQPMTRLIGD